MTPRVGQPSVFIIKLNFEKLQENPFVSYLLHKEP